VIPLSIRSAYLAGPMRGIEEYNFPAFRAAAEALRRRNWEIFSPAERDESDDEAMREHAARRDSGDWSEALPFAYYMEHDLAAVCKMDAVIVLEGWEASQGARLEAVTAVEVGHPVFLFVPLATQSLSGRVLDHKLESVPAEYVREVFAARGALETHDIEPTYDAESEPNAARIEQGAMRRFESGATRNVDASKPDYEGFESPLVEWAFGAFMNQNRIQADGSVRDSDNWQKGIPFDSYAKSMKRHQHDVWLHHRGFGELAEEDLLTALCALRFNVNGYIHEVVKGMLQGDGLPVFLDEDLVSERMQAWGAKV